MAGVFIKDMSLPEHCGACPLAILSCFGYRTCFVTEYDVTGCATYLEERHDRCPMVETEREE